jgi:hypothetical protein
VPNTRKTYNYDLKILKVDEENTPISGVTFDVYNDLTGETKPTKNTNSEGITTAVENITVDEDNYKMDNYF